jgi:hypothetical protein
LLLLFSSGDVDERTARMLEALSPYRQAVRDSISQTAGETFCGGDGGGAGGNLGDASGATSRFDSVGGTIALVNVYWCSLLCSLLWCFDFVTFI